MDNKTLPVCFVVQPDVLLHRILYLGTGMRLKYCVYVLQSLADLKWYIGFTSDLKRRLDEHLRGGAPATSFRRPFRLIYCEYHASKSDALRREGYFKTTPGKKALKLMLRNAMAAPE